MAVGKNAPYRILQTAFTAGEISNKVENRIDLDKFQFCLTKAENALIHPCGPIYKRPGMKYCAASKYNDKDVILVPFASGGDIDYMLEIGDKYIRVFSEGVYLGVELTTPYAASIIANLRFTQSADVMFVASGEHPLYQVMRYGHTDWQFKLFEIKNPYFDDILTDASADCTMTPSAQEGSITITASENVFKSTMVGGSIRLIQDVDTAVASIKIDKNTPKDESGTAVITSSSVYVGEQWKMETSGTWKGDVVIERSFDNTNWSTFRKYSSENNGNYTESGTVANKCWLRVIGTRKDGSNGELNINISAMAYSHTGWATITAYTNQKKVTAQVKDKLGSVGPTKNWAMSAWSSAFGYPRTVCFFQDKLCLGGTKEQPYTLWGSRPGRYDDFSIEKASGKITDDSAMCVSFISRDQQPIKHLIPATDLVVLTNGNEWIVSGHEVVTPNNVTPRLQTSRGCNNAFPVLVGNRIVYVQQRGSMVRDMGYSYETDSYGGNDLTLLSEEIVRGYKLIDTAYKQEPDSTIYFVRDDGTMACLAYIHEQKVTAWSTISTDGKVKAVCTVREGDRDVVYVSVERLVGGEAVRYIERMGDSGDSIIPNDYIMLDSAAVFETDVRTNTVNVPHLKGRMVYALGDGRTYKRYQVGEDGVLTLPGLASRWVVGLPYSMKLTLPDVAVGGAGNASVGLQHHISNINLRLLNTLGGMAGIDFANMDGVQYEQYLSVENTDLFSGDKTLTLPMGGYNSICKLCIESDDPYPFVLLSVVREVTFGD